MISKKSPAKKEIKKSKVQEHTLTSSKVLKTAQLKPHQKPVSNFLRSNDVSVLLGVAGCAKDFIQMHRAIEGVKDGEFEKIVICKPIVEAGRSIGFLPGLDEKFDPYLKSFYDSVYKIAGKEHSTSIKSKIQFEHVGFQRGNTLPEHSVIILSELQNLTLAELITFITRVPASSKLFCNGDYMQSDIGAKSGLKEFLQIISDIDGVGIAILNPETHQMRRKMINDIVNKYSNLLRKQGKSLELDTTKFTYTDL